MKTGTFKQLTEWCDDQGRVAEYHGPYYRARPGITITLEVESRMSDPLVEVILQSFGFEEDDVFVLDSCDGVHVFPHGKMINFRFYKQLTDVR